MSVLKALHAHYITERQHKPSTDGLPLAVAATRQAEYIIGEAQELCDAVNDRLHPPLLTADALAETRAAVRKEIADVVLATVTLANLLGVTVEDCIAEKTAADRGRG